MMYANVLSGTAPPKPAVCVEPDEDARSGRARVRVVFTYRSGVRSDVRGFDSLSEALAYARSLLSDDGGVTTGR